MDFFSFSYSFARPGLLITKRIFPMYKIQIPTALATITFLTTIFFGILLRNTKKKIRNLLLLGVKNRVNQKKEI